MRIRRGPATVTGEAHRRAAIAPPVTEPPRTAREGAEGRPGSQETSLRPPSRTPSWKGVAHSMKLSLSTGLAAGLLALAAAPALAAPVTVDLRVEGANATLFEGPVTTDTRAVRRRRRPHDCVRRRRRAARSSPRPPGERSRCRRLDRQFGNPSFTAIAGANSTTTPATGRFLGEYKNGAFAAVGACDDSVEAGDNVLFAVCRRPRARCSR